MQLVTMVLLFVEFLNGKIFCTNILIIAKLIVFYVSVGIFFFYNSVKKILWNDWIFNVRDSREAQEWTWGQNIVLWSQILVNMNMKEKRHCISRWSWTSDQFVLMSAQKKICSLIFHSWPLSIMIFGKWSDRNLNAFHSESWVKGTSFNG